MFSPTDTIVAIATPSGRGGIGVVRISGVRAAEVARAVLATPHALRPRYATHTFARPGPGIGTPREASGANSRVATNDVAHTGAPLEFVAVEDSPAGPNALDGPPCSGPARNAWRSFGTGAPNIDEVVATFFPAPYSYTTEDVIEISAHGSPAVLREIVRAAIGAGARLAEPGEFTFRAYLGGRIDLVQAEAVGDLVDAVTPLQARVAFDQLEGTITRSIAALDVPLFDLVVKLEASIDFPDEGYHFVDPQTVVKTLRVIGGGIDRLLGGARLGRVIREGRQIAIVGKPNVGKSSLFNWLLGAERAIVTDIPGTTRDMLRETMDFDGVRLSLVDTAGIRDVDDEIEREGVARARRVHSVADLVFVMLDASGPIDADDEEVLARTANAPRLVIVNKVDLPRAWTLSQLDVAPTGLSDPNQNVSPPGNVFQHDATPRMRSDTSRELAPAGDTPDVDAGIGGGVGAPGAVDVPVEMSLKTGAGLAIGDTGAGLDHGDGAAIEISLKTGAGLPLLRDAITRALEFAEPRVEEPLVTNIRHEALLRDARESVDRALSGLEAMGERFNEELVLADLAAARRAFDEVVGKRTSDDILRAIFERFCIGK